MNLRLPILCASLALLLPILPAQEETPETEAQPKRPPALVIPAETDAISRKILENFITVNGGQAAVDALESVVLRGEMKEGRTLYELQSYYKAPDKTLTRTWRRKMGKEYGTSFGSDKQTVWKIDDDGDRETFVVIRDDSAELSTQASVVLKLLHWQENGYVLEYVGKGNIGERAMLKVQAYHPRMAAPMLIYFDAKTFLPMRFRTLKNVGSGAFPVEVHISKYEKFGKIWMPREYLFLIDGESYGWLKAEKIHPNVPIEPSLLEPIRRGNIRLKGGQ